MQNSPALRFTVDDQHRAHELWGANCGPGAAAAVLGLTLEEIRPHLGDFERKRYTNPSLMFSVLRNVGARWSTRMTREWPEFGLARIQWEGPWTQPGVPIRARYRHTHWVGVRGRGSDIFDINCICVGGWVSQQEWSTKVVPWLLQQCEPRASGGWHVTHAIEVTGEAADGRHQ